MAEETDRESRTEPATGKKRHELRQKGKVPHSAEVNSGAVLIAALLLLFATGGTLARKIMEVMQQAFMSCGTYQITCNTMPEFFYRQVVTFCLIVAPIILGLMTAGFLAGFLQVGPLFTMKTLTINFGKFNPFNGIKKVMISRRSLVELIKSIVKALVIGIVAYVGVNNVINETVQLMDGDVVGIFNFIGSASITIAFKICLIYIAIAAIDFYYQKREYERDIRMTKQEVKEENIQTEGNPEIKSRIRRVQRALFRKRMMQNVPKADVVITNPTHYAVALQYNPGEMDAPTVVAKGMNLIAQKIKEIASEYNIPIVEDKPLAQALYKSVEIDQQIPEQLFQAVAQVLAYIYQMKNRKINQRAK